MKQPKLPMNHDTKIIIAGHERRLSRVQRLQSIVKQPKPPKTDTALLNALDKAVSDMLAAGWSRASIDGWYRHIIFTHVQKLNDDDDAA